MEAAWRRPSLADALIWVAGLAVGLAPLGSAWSSMGVVERLVSGFAFGGSLAGSAVFGVQRLFRGRRERGSAGELFGAVPAIFLAVVIASGYLIPPLALPLLTILVLGLGFLALVACGALVLALMGGRPRIPCPWSDYLGCVCCAVAGPYVFYCWIRYVSQV